ncbi:hypothetical protein IQ272_06985 [Chroococcidiopsidales cyanobacterium LEGE 13417]|nr:hypothetical protein [Chroococcidiopsidales cyanobacterium LEGE 13417]
MFRLAYSSCVMPVLAARIIHSRRENIWSMPRPKNARQWFANQCRDPERVNVIIGLLVGFRYRMPMRSIYNKADRRYYSHLRAPTLHYLPDYLTMSLIRFMVTGFGEFSSI